MDLSDIIRFVIIAGIIIYSVRKQLKGTSKEPKPRERAPRAHVQTAPKQEQADLDEYLNEIKQMLSQGAPQNPSQAQAPDPYQKEDYEYSSRDDDGIIETEATTADKAPQYVESESYHAWETARFEAEEESRSKKKDEQDEKAAYLLNGGTLQHHTLISEVVDPEDLEVKNDDSAHTSTETRMNRKNKVKVNLKQALIYQTILDRKF